MKTYCKKLEIDREFVQRAYRRWLRAPAGRKNGWRVQGECGGEAALVDEIAREIATRSLRTRPIRRYRSYDQVAGKHREIGVCSVKQQVLDYVAVQALEPLLEAKAGFYQASSAKGKGQLFAAKAARRWAGEGGWWVHMDVRKCYPSIGHGVVMGILERRVRSPDALYVCGYLLSTYRDGLEIGSYFSLRMAQLVLSFGYHHVEGLSKRRRGKRAKLATHQLWYMDDVWLFAACKRDLKKAARSLQAYLKGELGLEVKPWKACKAGEEMDVAGYVVRPGKTTLRRSLLLRARRAFRRFSRRPTLSGARRAASYWGWVKHSDSRAFSRKNGAPAAMARACRMISESTNKEALCQ